MHRLAKFGSINRSGVACVVILAGCAAPQISELRATAPVDQFTVSAPVPCLYEQAVEHVSSYLGLSEPKFQTYINGTGTEAWLRQPLTLIELKAAGSTTTVVSRRQTSSAHALGQADDLMAFLSGNPCNAPVRIIPKT